MVGEIKWLEFGNIEREFKWVFGFYFTVPARVKCLILLGKDLLKWAFF